MNEIKKKKKKKKRGAVDNFDTLILQTAVIPHETYKTV